MGTGSVSGRFMPRLDAIDVAAGWPLPPRGNRLVRRRPPITPMPAPPAGVSMLGASAPGPGPRTGSVVPGIGPRFGNSMMALRCGDVVSCWPRTGGDTVANIARHPSTGSQLAQSDRARLTDPHSGQAGALRRSFAPARGARVPAIIIGVTGRIAVDFPVSRIGSLPAWLALPVRLALACGLQRHCRVAAGRSGSRCSRIAVGDGGVCSSVRFDLHFDLIPDDGGDDLGGHHLKRPRMRLHDDRPADHDDAGIGVGTMAQ